MKSRVLLAFLSVAALTIVLARAQEPGKKADPKGTQIADEAALKEQILARQFAEFEQSLLKLKQRLERSPKREDQERAKILQKALDECRAAGLGAQFDQLIEQLKKQGLNNVGETKLAYERSAKLAEHLRKIVALLREDTKAAMLREEKLTLEKTIKEIEKLILKQKIIQGQNDVGKTEKIELGLNQNKVTKETADLAKKMAGGKGDPNDLKGKAKDGKTKGDGKAGEAKNVGKHGEKSEAKAGGKGSENKPGEAKAGAKGSKGSEAKPGESKSGKGGEAKSGQSKSGKGGKGGEAKESKSGQGKEGDKEGKAKEAGKDADGSKIKEKQGEAKSGEKKESDNKQGEAKSGSKSGDSKQSGAKGSKAGDSKSGESKAGAQSKQGEAKSGSQSSGQGQSKSGDAKSGKQPDSKGDNAKKGGDSPPPTASGKKQVEDANYKQKQAEDNIAKENKKGASDDMGKAIDDLEKAKKKLEDLLNQIREEELERLLAALQARCEKMLAMQIQVLAGTETVFKAIESHKDKKPARADQQKSLQLSDDEKEIVAEATKAIEMLEAEGSAVAFPEVFKQVREDMKHVQRRLGVVDTGVVTQAIEKDIIDTLKEMIEALKKARQELDNKKNPPSNNPPPPPQDQKLLDQIAELKMIRSMQIRVNSRTEIYGKQYNGEQAGEPAIVRELRNLSERQERIFEVTNRIAKGDNK